MECGRLVGMNITVSSRLMYILVLSKAAFVNNTDVLVQGFATYVKFNF